MSTECWNCGVDNELTSEIHGSDAQPSQGDCSICFGCAAVAVFTGDGANVRKPTVEEMGEFTSNPEVALVQSKVRQLRMVIGK